MPSPVLYGLNPQRQAEWVATALVLLGW